MNWYNELIKIEGVLGIAVKENSIEHRYDEDYKPKEGYFNSVEEAKELLDYEFSDGYGRTEGSYFTAWTNDRVYFPICYDGSEWIDSVPRNPCLEASEHKGGG